MRIPAHPAAAAVEAERCVEELGIRSFHFKADTFTWHKDYVLEVCVRGPVDEASGRVVPLARLDALVNEAVLSDFDHKDMNSQIPAFAETSPTTEKPPPSSDFS